MDRAQRAAALAGEVIALAQSMLMVHLRFLDRALAALRPVAHESLWFAADCTAFACGTTTSAPSPWCA